MHQISWERYLKLEKHSQRVEELNSQRDFKIFSKFKKIQSFQSMRSEKTGKLVLEYVESLTNNRKLKQTLEAPAKDVIEKNIRDEKILLF